MTPENEKNPLIWVLADDKPGHFNQSLGVAEALGHPFIVKKILFNEKSTRHNIFKFSATAGVDEEKSDKLSEPWPDLVIATGRKLAPIAKYIKKKSGGKTFITQIMWPGFPATGFDLLAIPEHDKKGPGKNRMITLGAPHRITKELLKHEAEIWEETFGKMPLPRLALLVGGSTGKYKFTKKHAEELAYMVFAVVKKLGGSLLVTVSRRTDEDVIDTLRSILADHTDFPVYFHDNKKGSPNPYYAILNKANAITVTGDSLSMCSEACAMGKPVYISAPDDITPAKHKLLHKNLYEKGYAIPLMQKEMSVYMPGKLPPLNPALDIAKKIKEMTGL